MPRLLIIAGPNGAGKTSFVSAYYAAEAQGFVFINADEIAREIADHGMASPALDIQAGRLMLKRIDEIIQAQGDLMLETTLASLTYARKIPIWQQAGYRVALIYLRLPSAEHAIQRVKRRVEAGGHDIPAEVVRTRFAKSRDYLESKYKPLVDELQVWDSLEGDFEPAELWTRDG
jgi:predicted ABC-type ATPase